VSKCVSSDWDSMSRSNFSSKFFCIIWSHTDFEILAVVAWAQYNLLCMRHNNSEVCRPRSNISGNLVHNVYQGSTFLWSSMLPENVNFTQTTFDLRTISANQTMEWDISSARWLCIFPCAPFVGRQHTAGLAAERIDGHENETRADCRVFKGLHLQMQGYVGDILAACSR